MNLEAVPAPKVELYNLVRKYSPANSECYCFIRDLMEKVIPQGTPDRDHEAAFLAMAFYYMGCVQGVREERRNRREKMNKKPQPIEEPKSRAELMQEITRRLESADYRKLRLVWVYASHLIG